ncbi:hypothetical protein [Streptomyces sp. PKU-EA00015]|uniref:hypothetical protein n=1 Tax=Streptomyces sp. PKU-EA00015 TaxID=2748326 RepID=UPI0015A4EA98|nr:hypothetical protein [Streptomyces sp. PKU-EA00015]
MPLQDSLLGAPARGRVEQVIPRGQNANGGGLSKGAGGEGRRATRRTARQRCGEQQAPDSGPAASSRGAGRRPCPTPEHPHREEKRKALPGRRSHQRELLRGKDSGGCARAFTIPELGVQAIVRRNGDTKVGLGARKAGTLRFSCAMEADRHHRLPVEGPRQ